MASGAGLTELGDDVIFNLAKCSSAIKLTVMYGVERCVSEFGAHALPSRADTLRNVRDITPAASFLINRRKNLLFFSTYCSI